MQVTKIISNKIEAKLLKEVDKEASQVFILNILSQQKTQLKRQESD